MARCSIGLLHPGEMGAAIGASLVAKGKQVSWASDGRRPQSARRAAAAGLADLGTVAALVAACDLLVSVCPPSAALEVARKLGSFGGVYLDANAISPGTAREVAAVIESGGGRYLDGGIIGPPPAPGRPTRLFLAGTGAGGVAELFAGTPVEASVLSERPTDASALKACYAAWTKGTSALLLAVRALAVANGVERALLAEWSRSQPDLADRSLRAAEQAATKGWRWVGEMEEIAAAFAAAGLPDGFHAAAAAVYSRPARDEQATAAPATLATVLEALAAPGTP